MDMVLIKSVLTSFLSAAIVFGFMFLIKVIMDKLVASHYDADVEIEENNNLGIALRRAGLYGGIAIAMFFTLGDIKMQFINGATVVGFMFIALIISEKIVFPSFDNTVALKAGNVSLGFAEAGLYLGTGVIAMASMAGTGPWISTIVFFVLGQLVLLLAVRLAEFTNKGLLEEIKLGNVAAGIMLGGMTFAYALILKGAIMGPFTGWAADITAFAISTVLGGLMLFLFANKAIDKLFLPGSSITKEIKEKNVAAITVVIGLKIAIAFIISGAVL